MLLEMLDVKYNLFLNRRIKTEVQKTDEWYGSFKQLCLLHLYQFVEDKDLHMTSAIIRVLHLSTENQISRAHLFSLTDMNVCHMYKGY